MASAGESFVIALARASKRAGKYLRGLQPADREDVLSTALLWCWEHRDTYNPGVSLDLWFVGAIRDALKAWEKGEERHAAELVELIPVADDTAARAEAQSAAEAALKQLNGSERKVVLLQSMGYTRREMRAKGVTKWAYDNAQARFKQLRELVPDPNDLRRVIRTQKATSSDDHVGPLAPIDKAIAALEFPPPTGAECPSCFRCRWYDGFLPSGKIPTRMRIVEDDVRAAVAATEARKIEIATHIRSNR